MKRFRKITAVLLSAVILICMFSVPASAVDFSDAVSDAITYPAISPATFSSSSSASRTVYLKMTLSDKGLVRFYDADSVTDSGTRFEILTAKGRSLLSGKYSDLTGKTRIFTSKGTYYLKIRLKKDQTIKRLFYTFIADDGEKVTKKVTLTAGKKTTLTSYISKFSGTIRWISSDKSVLRAVSGGKIIGVKAGTAKAYAFSSNGDYAVFYVTVKAPPKDT